jgi:hypothetical protein
MAMSAERPMSDGETPSSSAQSAANRVPDFFIVGHAKCGTTALYEMLRRHPQIHMPAKEPRFFAMKDIRLEPGGSDRQNVHEKGDTQDSQEVSGRRPRTLDGYRALFADARADQLIGEATPAYLRSSLAPERIASVQPDARIIAILREPTSFLRSFHLQSVRGYNETQSDFQKAIALVEPRREGRSLPRLSRTPWDLLYTDHVRYVEQLRRYERAFSREQMLVLIYDDFRADNDGTIREVLRFLDVDDTVPIDAVEANPTVHPRSQLLNELVHAVGVGRGPVSRTLKGAIKTVTPAAPRRAAFHAVKRQLVFAAPPEPDEELMRELRVRFKGEVQAVSEYLDRDLVALWGYDRLD